MAPSVRPRAARPELRLTVLEVLLLGTSQGVFMVVEVSSTSHLQQYQLTCSGVAKAIAWTRRTAVGQPLGQSDTDRVLIVLDGLLDVFLRAYYEVSEEAFADPPVHTIDAEDVAE